MDDLRLGGADLRYQAKDEDGDETRRRAQAQCPVSKSRQDSTYSPPTEGSLQRRRVFCRRG
jgi:hypothetical protein